MALGKKEKRNEYKKNLNKMNENYTTNNNNSNQIIKLKHT